MAFSNSLYPHCGSVSLKTLRLFKVYPETSSSVSDAQQYINNFPLNSPYDNLCCLFCSIYSSAGNLWKLLLRKWKMLVFFFCLFFSCFGQWVTLTNFVVLWWIKFVSTTYYNSIFLFYSIFHIVSPNGMLRDLVGTISSICLFFFFHSIIG